MYVKSVELKSDYRCFKSGDTFEFKNINLFVGDQGCGKSTLMELMFNSQKHKDLLNVDIYEHIKSKGVKSYYFNSEKDNPRIKDFNSYSNPDGTSKGIGVGAAIASKFRSHGEVLLQFTINGLDQAEDCVVFLDEPESGLSLRNQFKLNKSIDNALKRNCQLFIATHSIILIEDRQEVLSLEHKNWMTGNDFIFLNKDK